MTSPAVYELAVKLGYRDVLERAGAKLMSGTCAGEMRGELLPYEVMATDSCKQNYYISGHLYPRKIDAWYGTTEDCIHAATTGKWSGEWR
jgi:predicted aconitase